MEWNDMIAGQILSQQQLLQIPLNSKANLLWYTSGAHHQSIMMKESSTPLLDLNEVNSKTGAPIRLAAATRTMKRLAKNSDSMSSASSDAGKSDPDGHRNNKAEILYKTELCKSFTETGKCRYGDKCQFAHGHGDLREKPRHPKFKTVPCRTFQATGLCPYGQRCNFIHENPLGVGRGSAVVPRDTINPLTMPIQCPPLQNTQLPLTPGGSAGESPLPSFTSSSGDEYSPKSNSPGSAQSWDEDFGSWSNPSGAFRAAAAPQTQAPGPRVFQFPPTASRNLMGTFGVDLLFANPDFLMLDGSAMEAAPAPGQRHGENGRLPIFSRITAGNTGLQIP